MNDFEKSAIVGYYRNGMEINLIAAIMGIPVSYAEMIINEYLKPKK